ncbi:hypothetical protein HY04AAS1_0539 [Hydrogenobaculum sp. Y04AAS1]|uniref:hypothetical protein n=1 Tax=Hydrogenobaculum sp. (strain Y04AAS1) TaxID=380749 RepID=UPI00015BD2EA|nr:hypothetical protein HY04AAS1_0539 [Hydrogenobaculum sp. Y04AAS1]HCT66379.1 hypothetical protein [Hydrogenobaculum sp.]
MKLRSLWRAKMLNRVRLIRCKSQKSLERMEEKLIKMNKRVAVVDKNGLLDIIKNEDAENWYSFSNLSQNISQNMPKFVSLDISRVNVLLVLDEEP